MTQYEVVYLLRDTLSPEELQIEQEAMLKIITNKGGKVIDQNQAGSRELAYPIAKAKSAFYVLLLVKMSKQNVAPLKREGVVNINVLRVFVLSTEKHPFYQPDLNLNRIQISAESFAQATNNMYYFRRLSYQRRQENKQEAEQKPRSGDKVAPN